MLRSLFLLDWSKNDMLIDEHTKMLLKFAQLFVPAMQAFT